MIREVHAGSGSQIRILILYPSRIQGSKRRRIPDPEQCFFSVPGDGEAGQLPDGEESLGPAAPGRLRAPPHLHLQPQAAGLTLRSGALAIPTRGKGASATDGMK